VKFQGSLISVNETLLQGWGRKKERNKERKKEVCFSGEDRIPRPVPFHSLFIA
jgi:hypothetical protein